MCTSWLYRTTRQVDVTSRHDCEPTSPKALEVQRLRVSGHALSQPVSQPCPIQLIPTCQNPAISCNSLLGVFTVRLKWCMHVCVCVRVCSEVVWRALLIPLWCGRQLFCPASSPSSSSAMWCGLLDFLPNGVATFNTAPDKP
jgi:hypothetical protein